MKTRDVMLARMWKRCLRVGGENETGRHYAHENIMTWENELSPFPVSSRMGGGVNKGLSS